MTISIKAQSTTSTISAWHDSNDPEGGFIVNGLGAQVKISTEEAARLAAYLVS